MAISDAQIGYLCAYATHLTDEIDQDRDVIECGKDTKTKI
jgi:hypothetical protein